MTLQVERKEETSQAMGIGRC